MPLTRLGDFTLGILAARLYVLVSSKPIAARVGRPLTVVAGLTICALMAWPANLYSAWSWDVEYAVPAALLIFGLAVAPHASLARLLSFPLAILLGESSYAFYLVHQPALAFFGAGRWSVAVSATTIAFELLTLGAIVCLAIGLHVAVERPARRYIRQIAGAGGRRAGQWHGPREVLP